MHGGTQHPTAAEPLNSSSDADHSGPSMHQGEEAAFVRTPSGHMVRRTSSSVGLPLSASGKEVWRQVRLSESMQHSQGPCNKQSDMHVCTWQHHQQTCMCFHAEMRLLLVLSASGADTSGGTRRGTLACPAPTSAHVVLHFTVEAAPQVTCHKSVVHACHTSCPLTHCVLQDTNDADEELLLQAFVPHMQQLLGLALKYSQQATGPQHAAWSPPSTARLLGKTLPDGLQQQAARCSNFTASVDNIRPAVTLLTPFLAGVTDAAGAGESAGQQVLTGGSSGWFDCANLQESSSAVFSPLREWQPLSPTRQGRYQRIFPHQAVAAAQPGLRAVQSARDVGAAGVTVGRAGSQQLQQEAGAAEGIAAWQQQSREVARLLLQALLVLVREHRCVC
jgi:hypothetical protein